MVINALYVCVSVMFTSLLLIRPVPQIPLWLQTVAGKTNKNGPSLRQISQNISQTMEDELKQMEVANGYKETRDLTNKVADILCEMQIIKKLEETNKDEDIEMQWKEIASRLNKILFFLFSFVLLILLLVGFFLITNNIRNTEETV